MLFFFCQLVLKYTTDDSVKHLVDKLEWIIIPVVNIDGYAYTHSTVSSLSGNKMKYKLQDPQGGVGGGGYSHA